MSFFIGASPQETDVCHDDARLVFERHRQQCETENDKESGEDLRAGDRVLESKKIEAAPPLLSSNAAIPHRTRSQVLEWRLSRNSP
jgi:hypothetical protein